MVENLSVELQNKIRLLNSMGTKDLVIKLQAAENTLEKSLCEYNSFRDLNYEFVAPMHRDCDVAQSIIADLIFKAPQIAGKDMTVDQRSAWLTQQRKENKELIVALDKQQHITFHLENLRVSADIAKEKMEGLRAVIALKTAQINFLAK